MHASVGNIVIGSVEIREHGRVFIHLVGMELLDELRSEVVVVVFLGVFLFLFGWVFVAVAVDPPVDGDFEDSWLVGDDRSLQVFQRYLGCRVVQNFRVDVVH